MKINFVLPPNGNHPIGGFKIIFQYANQLVKNGNDVSISFLKSLYPEQHRYLRGLYFLWRLVQRILHKNIDNRRITWFDLDDRVKLFFNIIYSKEMPESDIIVATAVQTAKYINGIDKRFGKKFYFIQGYETWAYPVEEVNETFSLPYTKIVISNWLYKIVGKYTNDKVYIVPNFIDTSVFKLSNSLDSKENIVSLMYHTAPEKNTEFGLKVLDKVKKRIPDLKVKLFGVFEEPNNLPSYVKYYKKPNQRRLCKDIYGTSKVYILPSLLEGWGLTGMEAMASGAVLVSSDVGGVSDYATDGVDSFLIKPNDLDMFVKKIEDILNNDKLRLQMANSAIVVGKEFSLTKSTKSLENIFNKNGDNI